MNPRKVKRVVYTVGNGEAPQIPVPNQAVQQPPQPQYQGQGALPGYSPQPGFAAQQPQVQYNQPPAQPQFQQPAYQQSPPPPGAPTGTFAPTSGAPAPGTYGQPQADWNPYAQQQVPPMQGGSGPIAPSVPGPPAGAPSTGPASPSSVPADWPADVPFQPGLTVQQARMAAAMNLPQVAGSPQ